MKITCAIFDADGTLLDSMPMWKAITYEYAQDRGLTRPRPAPYLKPPEHGAVRRRLQGIGRARQPGGNPEGAVPIRPERLPGQGEGKSPMQRPC